MFIHFSTNIRDGKNDIENAITIKKAPQSESSVDALITLIDMTDQPEGVHKIETHLFSISLTQLSSLQEIALEFTNTDFSSAEYRVTSITLDIAHYRLFKPVKRDVPAENPNPL